MPRGVYPRDPEQTRRLLARAHSPEVRAKAHATLRRLAQSEEWCAHVRAAAAKTRRRRAG